MAPSSARRRDRGVGWILLLSLLVVPFAVAACASQEPAATSESTGAAPAEPSAPSDAISDAKGESVTEETSTAANTMPVKPEVEPQHVQVQHILIAFSGSIPGKNITRTKDEAKKLAYEILERARKGEDFDELVRAHTNDSPPGIYGMAAIGVAPGPGEYRRDGMVPAFGNVGFAISPGNIGIADFDPQASPYGWHIIKRLQ